MFERKSDPSSSSIGKGRLLCQEKIVGLQNRFGVRYKRNLDRFPEDFMFQLGPQEVESLRFQFGTSKKGRGGRRYLPYAFTQEGVAMLSGVLNSPRAIQANILIMRTFTKLREMITTNELIRQKIEELEKKYNKHDQQFKVVFEAIRELLGSPKPSRKKPIGFHAKY